MLTPASSAARTRSTHSGRTRVLSRLPRPLWFTISPRWSAHAFLLALVLFGAGGDPSA
jgi:hypothetical protein